MNPRVLVLYELSRVFTGGGDSVLLSSSEVGEILGVSQQTASRYLNELEQAGLIRKRRSGLKQRIEFTDEGVGLLNEFYLNLRDFFEGGRRLVLEGIIVKGIGDGAYYVGEYVDKLREKLGINPFLGTLNVRLDAEPLDLGRHATGVIDGFRREGRAFGRLGYIPVRLSGETWGLDCFLVLPERTHHRGEVEVISERNLRKEYGLRDGDSVRMEAPI